MANRVVEENIKVIEEALCTWILQESRRNRSRHGVRDKDVLNIIAYFKSELEIGDAFLSTRKWITDFKQRHNLYIITNGPCKPLARRFQPLELVHKFGIQPSQIYIADEAGLYWRFKYSDSLDPDFLTFLTCANITGTHKIRPFVIGKIKDPPSLQYVDPPIVYCSQRDGLMSRSLFYKWFTTYFVSEVQGFMDSEKTVLLIIDSATYHPQPGNLISVNPNIQILYIPLESTEEDFSQILFKYMKRKYKDDFLKKVLSSGNVDSLTQFNIRDMAYLLDDCWSSVPQSIIDMCWKSIIGRREDHASFDAHAVEVVQTSLLNQVCTLFNLEPAGIQAWYDGVGESVPRLMDDYEILNNALSITLEGEDLEEPLCLPSATKVSVDEAFPALDLCLRWAQENGYSSSETLLLREMRAKAFNMIESEQPLKYSNEGEDDSDTSAEEVLIIEEIRSETELEF